MAPAPHPREGVFVFDAARALAALAVLVSHARGLVLLDAADQPSLSAVGTIVFAATGLGHQAVVVFFVVSGALVTRSLLRMHVGVWSPSDFAVARLSRLLVVLIPCLLLGAAEDRLGLAGAAETYGSPGTSAAAVAHRLGAGTLAGNLAFLQGMSVPVFGSNVPLWTLSVEAWCYACAFCAFALLRVAREPIQAVGCIAALGLALIFVLTPAFWQLAPLWAIGAAAGLVLPGHKRRRTRSDQDRAPCSNAAERRNGLVHAAAGLALVGAVLVARSIGERHQALADYALASIAAWALVILSSWEPHPGFVVRALRRVAGFSYSLYLSHFPMLALCAAFALQGRRLSIEVGSLALAASMALAALGQAVMVWALFERRTGLVRDALLGLRRGFAVRHSRRFAP